MESSFLDIFGYFADAQTSQHHKTKVLWGERMSTDRSVYDGQMSSVPNHMASGFLEHEGAPGDEVGVKIMCQI